MLKFWSKISTSAETRKNSPKTARKQDNAPNEGERNERLREAQNRGERDEGARGAGARPPFKLPKQGHTEAGIPRDEGAPQTTKGRAGRGARRQRRRRRRRSRSHSRSDRQRSAGAHERAAGFAAQERDKARWNAAKRRARMRAAGPNEERRRAKRKAAARRPRTP